MVTAEDSLTKYLADVLAQMSGRDIHASDSTASFTHACVGMSGTWHRNVRSGERQAARGYAQKLRRLAAGGAAAEDGHGGDQLRDQGGAGAVDLRHPDQPLRHRRHVRPCCIRC